MQVFLIPVLVLVLGACSTMQARRPNPSILVDLDPASASRRTRLVARMDRRHELSGSSARHEEDSPLEAPTFITTSAVPLLSG